MKNRLNLLKCILLAIAIIFVAPFIVKADDTLQSKIENANSGDVIVLEKSYEEVITIAADKNIIIDLNGYNITTNIVGKDTISNNGTLTIKGTGYVTSIGAAVTNYPGGKVTINNGNYLSTGWYTIKNMGEMIINNLHFGNNVNNGASLIDNGFVGSSAWGSDRGMTYNSSKPVKLTINNGTFENKNNSCNVIKNDDYGNLIINGGTFIAGSDSETNGNPVIQNWNIATINGGTFTSKNGFAVANGALKGDADKGLITIKGGSFKGKYGILGLNGGAASNLGKLTIEGGTFDGTLGNNSKYYVYGNVNYYEIVIKGGTFTDSKVESNLPEGYKSYSVINSTETIVAKPEDLVEKTYVSVLEEKDIVEDVKLIKKIIKDNQKLVGFYNIDLYKTLDGAFIEQIEETDSKVKVTISLPTNIEKKKDGYSRNYFVVRLHDGKTEVIDAIDNGDGTISFESDKFSTYALGYTDVSKLVDNPKTFDKTLLYCLISIISVAGVVIISRYIKKQTI